MKLSNRQFLHTVRQCENIQTQIKKAFPYIKELIVFLDKDEDGHRIITVKFNKDASPYTEEDLATYIDNNKI